MGVVQPMMLPRFVERHIVAALMHIPLPRIAWLLFRAIEPLDIRPPLRWRELGPVVDDQPPEGDAERAAGKGDVPLVAQDIGEVAQMGDHGGSLWGRMSGFSVRL